MNINSIKQKEILDLLTNVDLVFSVKTKENIESAIKSKNILIENKTPLNDMLGKVEYPFLLLFYKNIYFIFSEKHSKMSFNEIIKLPIYYLGAWWKYSHNFNEVINEQYSKVIISPDYGAGLSTWFDKSLATNKRLIEIIEKYNIKQVIKNIRNKNIGKVEKELLDIISPYFDEKSEFLNSTILENLEKAEIIKIPKGKIYRINEYDGAEYIDYCDDFIIAE